MRLIWSFLALVPILLLTASPLKAQEEAVECERRFVTLVNPVRGRDKWSDKTITPLVNQYSLVKKEGFAATWLLQYDALTDPEVASRTKSFDPNQEIGLFLEVSPDLAKEARVIYPTQVAWANPRVLFLSGYLQSERRKLIDALFLRFKKTFGYFPRSIGAWWIDSYSLNYLREKYDVTAAMIVADQKTTDNYGVWGQWWGVAYYPSKANILTPANSLADKQDVVVTQWAQRDFSLAYGDGPKYSNYSLQANDYLGIGKDTRFFEKLVNNYSDCRVPLSQITVGLETGIESSAFLPEYKNQLASLKRKTNFKSVTLSEFSDIFKRYYQDFPKEVRLKDENSEWILTPLMRVNSELGDKVVYNPQVSFSDYFIADKSSFLDRRLSSVEQRTSEGGWQQYFLLIFLLAGLLYAKKKKFGWFLPVTLFTLGAFGLLLKSKAQYGWFIYYGPVVANLEYVQAIVLGVAYLFFYMLISSVQKRIKRNLDLFYWSMPLSFGFDKLISALRYSSISGERYFGIAIDTLRFVGIKVVGTSGVDLVNQDFQPAIAASLLRFNPANIWGNNFLSFVIYPLAHLLFASILFLILIKTRKRLRNVIILILAALFVGQVLAIFGADPRVVLQSL